MSSSRVYGGMTAIERGRQRRTQLLVAAVTLLGTRGAAATTVTAVCSEAGLTSRYFYEQFPDRDALLRGVADDVFATLEATLVGAMQSGVDDFGVLARAPIDALIRLVDNDRILARIIFVESGAEPILRALRNDTVSRMTNLLVDKVSNLFPIRDSALPIMQLTATMMVSGMSDVLRRWLDNEIDMSADQVAEHTTALFAGAAAYALTLAAPTGD
ncbi:TetR/AcrR family transcriptional regulator [Antrihabitans sp. NCIMB 15449]|uniref:TetR/AcrR family transcriptional regulator n=1 Tax=Antrihabitans spumae TaxID=3373370 RepID=A0ABW7JL57_9NOCA